MVDKVDDILDLDALRGWRELRDPTLRASHRLPALARLILLDHRDRPQDSYEIHGDDLLLGRFQPHYAPVDLAFHRLKDHELYRLGAPHIHLAIHNDSWQLQALSPQSITALNDRLVPELRSPNPLKDGDLLTLGVTRFRFETAQSSRSSWLQERARLLAQVDAPALFLKRDGSPCGPYRTLSQDEPLLLGRTFPEPGLLPGTKDWPAADANTWDLSGLYDHERRHLSFRHARIQLQHGRWVIEPLTGRQRTFVNRIAISSPIPLEAGDEIGLGNVLFRFHHPHRSIDDSTPRYVPAVPDWSEGIPPANPRRRR